MTNKMRVLVLGATGYVGRHIVQTLAATDWAEPIAASRHGAVALDATDTTALIPALQRADAIVNAMAASPQDMIANAQALTDGDDGPARGAAPIRRLTAQPSPASQGKAPTASPALHTRLPLPTSSLLSASPVAIAAKCPHPRTSS